MYMLVMVLDDSTRLNDVLEAWMRAGIRGITIFESTGLNRVLQRETAAAVFAGLRRASGSGRVGHNTIFAVIEDLETAETAVSATAEVIGDLDQPDTGIIFAVPVIKSWGLPQPLREGE